MQSFHSFIYLFISLFLTILLGFPVIVQRSLPNFISSIDWRSISSLPVILRQDSMVSSQAPSDESSGYERETITKRDAKRRFASYLWDTLDKPYEERRLLFKLDAALLSFASLGG